MTIELNVYHTIAIAIVILIAGEAIRNRVMVLQKYCIPVPVVGGLLCTVIILIGHETGAFEIKFDMAFKDFFMLLFYSGIGFTASWKLLKKGGPQVIIFLIISSVVVVFQNLLGVGLSKLMGIDPLIGLATGSIPMTGGHGTSAAFAPVLEEAGLANANTISLAAATFGLVAGSLIGGPTGRFLIEHYHLKSSDAAAVSVKLDDKELGKASGGSSERALTVGAYQLLIAVSLGCLVSDLLAKTGLSFPASVGGDDGCRHYKKHCRQYGPPEAETSGDFHYKQYLAPNLPGSFQDDTEAVAACGSGSPHAFAPSGPDLA